MKDEIKLRDYFAGKALQGMVANNEMWTAMCMDRRRFARNKQNDTAEDFVAQQCYKVADAMLKEREFKINNNDKGTRNKENTGEFLWGRD